MHGLKESSHWHQYGGKDGEEDYSILAWLGEKKRKKLTFAFAADIMLLFPSHHAVGVPVAIDREKLCKKASRDHLRICSRVRQWLHLTVRGLPT